MRNKQIRLASLLSTGLLLLGVPAISLITAEIAPQVVLADDEEGEPGATEATINDVITAVNTIPTEIREFNRIKATLTAEQVSGEDVQALLEDATPAQQQQYNTAVQRNQARIANLRNVLNSNPAVREFLQNEEIEISQVVAIQVQGTQVAIFYDGGSGQGGEQPGATEATINDVITAVNTIPTEIREFNRIKATLTAEQVSGEDVQALLEDATPAQQQQYNTAVQRNQARINNLRNVLNSNAAVREFLQNEEIEISQVVAIQVQGTQVTIFHDGGSGQGGEQED